MRPTDQVTLKAIFDSVALSPLGLAITQFFSSLSEDASASDPLAVVRERLCSFEYGSIADFLSDFRLCVDSASRRFGADLEVSLALESVYGEVVCLLRGFCVPERDCLVSRLSLVSSGLRVVCDDLPDDLESFVSFCSAEHVSVESRPASSIVSVRDDLAEDLEDLHRSLNSLRSDEEVSQVIDVITRMDTSYSHDGDQITIDLGQCSSETLEVIRGLVRSFSES